MVSDPHSELGSQIVLQGVFDQYHSFNPVLLTLYCAYELFGGMVKCRLCTVGPEWGPKTLHPNRLPDDGAAAGTVPRFETVARL